MEDGGPGLEGVPGESHRRHPAAYYSVPLQDDDVVDGAAAVVLEEVGQGRPGDAGSDDAYSGPAAADEGECSGDGEQDEQSRTKSRTCHFSEEPTRMDVPKSQTIAVMISGT